MSSSSSLTGAVNATGSSEAPGSLRSSIAARVASRLAGVLRRPGKPAFSAGQNAAQPHAPAPPSERLVQAAALGDRRALSELVHHVTPIVVMAVRVAMGRGSADSDDLAQESLIAFMCSLGSFRRECSIEHFARRIALHRCLDARKRERVAERAESKIPVETHAEPVSVLPGESELLRALVAELPFEQAEAVLLRYVWEYGVSEIGQMTGTPVNTVRSRLRLAREQLRRLLSERGLSLGGGERQ